jgi:hypothetical protein
LASYLSANNLIDRITPEILQLHAKKMAASDRSGLTVLSSGWG